LGSGVWLLYLLNYNLSVAVGVGFIALAGIAVDSFKSSEKELNRERLFAYITEAASQRVRPIMMTTCSTIAGLLPSMEQVQKS